MAFFQALSGIFSIIIIVGVGYLLAKRSWVNEEISAFIPRLVNYIALPTFMLWNLTHNFDANSLKGVFYGLAVPFSSMFICCILALFFSKVLKVAPHRRGVFRAVFFCSNTVFIGIPVNLALFGEVSTPYVLLYFLVNTFFFWTVGNYFIGKDKKGAQSKLFSIGNLKKIFSPPFLGFIFAITIVLLEVHLPEFIINTARYLGNMTTPLSLLFIGIVLFKVKREDLRLDKDVIGVLLGRFVISPLTVMLVTLFIPIPLLMKKVFIIQAALPAMTQVTIIAKAYGADTEYAATLTAITTLVSALVIPIYMCIL